jgi:hypothetical protein
VESSPPPMFNIASVNSHLSKADQSSSSVDLLNGSKFDLIVPTRERRRKGTRKQFVF